MTFGDILSFFVVQMTTGRLQGAVTHVVANLISGSRVHCAEVDKEVSKLCGSKALRSAMRKEQISLSGL